LSFVLDNSVAMTWCFEDEATAPTDALLAHIMVSGAVTPAFWALEATNVLIWAQIKGRINGTGRIKKMAFLYDLPITSDMFTREAAWAPTAALAVKYRLTSYDAAYLELALRRTLPLATLDEDLRRAAKAEKVEVLGK
jgi:predicted nucleic acid-binding protein